MEGRLNYGRWKATAQFLNFKSHRIAYFSAGKGPVISLIHGFPTSSYDWVKIWPALSKRYRVIAVDMLGFGSSAKPRPYDYSIQEQAEIWEYVWQELGVGKTAIVAHDYGDTVALELLMRQQKVDTPRKIKQVMLLNGGIVPGAYQPRLIQKLMASFIGPCLGVFLGRKALARNFKPIFGRHYKLTEAELTDFWSEISESKGKWALPYVGRYLRERKKYAGHWRSALAKPGVPLFLYWGLADPISGEKVYRGIKVLNPDVVSIELPDVGHYPQWEDPLTLVAMIEKMVT